MTTSLVSKAMCLPAIFNAFRAVDPKGQGWHFTKELQKKFYNGYAAKLAKDLPKLEKFLKAKATNNAAELNKWFAANGWPGMQVNFPPSGYGVGSIFDLLVDWPVPGKTKKIYVESENRSFPGALMHQSSHVRGFEILGYKFPMFQLNTNQDGWSVFLVEADKQYNNLQLPAVAQKLLQAQKKDFFFEKLHFPCVSMAMSVDVSWMAGMKSKTGFRIDEAIKQVRLRLDDKGARAESAFAMVSRGMSSNDGTYAIDKPFFVIFSRNDLNFPAFVALTTPADWSA